MPTIKLKNITLDLTQDQVDEIITKYSKSKVWKPEYGDYYFCINYAGKVDEVTWLNDSTDQFYFSIGNVFKTKAEAIEALEVGWVARLRAETTIRNYIKEKGYEFEPDWNDGKQTKFCIFYDHNVPKLVISSYWTCQEATLPYFSCKEHAEGTMKACEKEYKLLFGVKE